MVDYSNNIYSCLRPTLAMAQCFGLMPLQGINDGADKLKFTWRTWRIVYSVMVLCGISFCGVTCLLKTFETGVKMFKLGKILNIYY